MTCPFNQHLEAFYDGELDEARRSEIERHLPNCPSCAAELGRLQAMSGMLASASAVKLSQIGLYRLHNRVDQAMEEGLLRIVRVLSAVAACVLVAGSVWLMKTREDRTVEMAMPVAPPWADVVEASDSPAGAYSTPAAAWYLAQDSARSDDSP
ncbi:MAG TPA: zf-HC2 domain-containing protein [Tepidisphaeraceae bacterium]|jgi:anti-sigma factor RsiW|nr:zf-HC2 domain-containing protein [Tepidisphaeraceae bacterium]